jgi:holo-[acyl-carrier protein] synthase
MKNKIKIGIDIEKVEKFKLEKKDKFLSENFTEGELKYAYSKTRPEIHLCGIFCAKEALKKTLKDQKILLKHMEISYDKSGKPLVRLLNDNRKNNFLLSISHCGDHAIAVVLNL